MSNSPSPPQVLVLHPEDDVGVVRLGLAPGMAFSAGTRALIAKNEVRPGHKVAIRPLQEGDAIRKYGQIIGFATRAIEAGEHVHTHNVTCGSYERDPAVGRALPAPVPDVEARTFEGYRRADGRVGTRNYVAVVSTVNCSASSGRGIAEHFTPEVMRAFANVDGVFAVTHKTGCGMAGGGRDRVNLERTLAGFSNHPNVGGYVVIGLGCEVNQAHEFVDRAHLRVADGKRPTILTVQGSGGIASTIGAGVEAVEELLPRVNEYRRSPVPVGKLILGTNCGGSDGHSGITANPALGVASDLIVAHGGISILGETTEIYGAEHLLTRRAVRKEVGEKLLERIRWWEWYTSIFEAEIDNNPSYGNKEGGLTTIFEKSLGAIAKGGSSPLVDVVDYAERVRTPGLVVMDTPGFDPVSVTGIIAGGATVMVFTTGRGSVLGTKPTPTLKVATHSLLYERMESDMDFDAGVILEGVPVEVVGRRLFEEIIAVASGKKTKSEAQGLGDDEFAPWTIGPVL